MRKSNKLNCISDQQHPRDQIEGWREMSSLIPFLSLDPNWRIAVIPPFCGAAARFIVEDERGGSVSVYLDTCNALGYMDYMHWEIYPDAAGDNWRCQMENGQELIEAIRASLKQQSETEK